MKCVDGGLIPCLSENERARLHPCYWVQKPSYSHPTVRRLEDALRACVFIILS